MAKQVSCFLLVLLIFSCGCGVQIQARDSFFFSKLTHYSINKHHEKIPKKVISPVEAPTLAPVQAPTPAPAFAPTATLQSGLDEKELVNQGVRGFSYQSSNYNNNEYKSTGETFLTGHENENYYNNNGYKLNGNGYESGNYNNNGYSTNYKNIYNGYYETGRQGMSDTRSLENGRYYYDIKNGNNNYPAGYEGARINNGKSYYGNSEGNELNSINEEEYQNQEEYQESPENYVP